MIYGGKKIADQIELLGNVYILKKAYNSFKPATIDLYCDKCKCVNTFFKYTSTHSDNVIQICEKCFQMPNGSLPYINNEL